ncbi:hypothetical protein BC826DRAFT_1177631 [Russula brevipes]|nr:hypothetical protein BC826DRAFT_1177631 [Russula brevipes]
MSGPSNFPIPVESRRPPAYSILANYILTSHHMWSSITTISYLSDEVDLFWRWKRKFSLFTFLFLLNRYVALIGDLPILVSGVTGRALFMLRNNACIHMVLQLTQQALVANKRNVWKQMILAMLISILVAGAASLQCYRPYLTRFAPVPPLLKRANNHAISLFFSPSPLTYDLDGITNALSSTLISRVILNLRAASRSGGVIFQPSRPTWQGTQTQDQNDPHGERSGAADDDTTGTSTWSSRPAPPPAEEAACTWVRGRKLFLLQLL